MAPKYKRGATIYVDPGKEPNHLSNVVVWLQKDKVHAFRQLVIENGRKLLRPLNDKLSKQKLIPLSESDLVCGTVIGQYIDD